MSAGPPVITRFEAIPGALLSRKLEIRWDLPGSQVPLAEQDFIVEVRPSLPDGEWTKRRVKSARVTRVNLSEVRGSARADSYEARVCVVGGANSEIAIAALGGIAPAVHAEHAVPLVAIESFSATPHPQGVLLAVTWTVSTEEGYQTWAPEFVVAFRQTGSAGIWAEFRSGESHYETVARTKLVTSMDVKVRAILGGNPGDWSAEMTAPVGRPGQAQAPESAPHPDPASTAEPFEAGDALPREAAEGSLEQPVAVEERRAVETERELRPAQAVHPEDDGARPKAPVGPEVVELAEQLAYTIGRVNELEAKLLAITDSVLAVQTLGHQLASAAVEALSPQVNPVDTGGGDAPRFTPLSYGDGLAAHVLRSPMYRLMREQAGRGAPEAGVITAVLSRAAASTDPITRDELQELLLIDTPRIRGVHASLKRVLNVDGYQAVDVDASTGALTIDVELVAEQFGYRA